MIPNVSLNFMLMPLNLKVKLSFCG